MRLITSEEMRSVDRHAIGQIGIPSLVLMENAGVKVLFTLEKILEGLKGKRFTIVCGKGNNGGDGLVVARHLINSGVAVHVFLTSEPDKLSDDCKANYLILKEMGYEFPVIKDLDGINKLRIAMEFSECVIDAVFGTGISGNITGFTADIIRAMNDSMAKKISIDLPSGVCGTTGKVSDPTFEAEITITLALPKVGLFLFPGRDFVGEIWIADIGIPKASLDFVPASYRLITTEMVNSYLPIRSDNLHKGNTGHLLLLAGSKEYRGAGVLSAYGALRSGVGIVTLGLPENLDGKLIGEIPSEIITKYFTSDKGYFDIAENEFEAQLDKYAALVAGPGWGQGDALKRTLNGLLKCWSKPLVLDADALNCIDKSVKLEDCDSDIIITPHIGEMSRLTGLPKDEIKEDMAGVANDFAEKHRCVVVLKSSVTVIAAPGAEVFICSRPNSGLAKGGSGDLLSGLIGGLLAIGCKPIIAAVAGVFIHSEAGELAREELGADAMTISEVVSFIPKAYKNVRNS